MRKNWGKGMMHGKSGCTVNRGPVNRGFTVCCKTSLAVALVHKFLRALHRSNVVMSNVVMSLYWSFLFLPANIQF